MKILPTIKKISTVLLGSFLIFFILVSSSSAFFSTIFPTVGVSNFDQTAFGGYVGDVSNNGRYIVFVSYRSDLVVGDTNGVSDVFVYDRNLELHERITVDSLGNQSVGFTPTTNWSVTMPTAISFDGRYIVFASPAPDLVSGDTNGVSDVFVHDRDTGTTERVSVDSLGAQANGTSYGENYRTGLGISSDGRYVVFSSLASNLVPGDTNGVSDVFVHDRDTGTTERVSVDSLGVEGNDDSLLSSFSSIFSSNVISSDGRYVVFNSNATNIYSGDTNGGSDVFIHDRNTGITSRAGSDVLESESFISFDRSVISDDGAHVVFVGTMDDFATPYVFIYDMILDEIEYVSQGSTDPLTAFYALDISSDGRYVAYNSSSNDNLEDFSSDEEIFIYDTNTNTVRRISNEFGEEPSTDVLNFLFIGDGSRYGVFAGGGIGATNLYDTHNPPVDVSISPSEIYENEPINTLVSGDIENIDIDLSDTHSYSIACSIPGPDDPSFIVDGNNLRSTEIFDFETKFEYEVCIRVEDNTGLVYENTVYVYVLNAVPSNINLSSSSIQENQALNTVIGALSTINTEVSDSHTYSFSCTTPGVDDSSFNISGSNLQSSASFDFESKSSYDICIRTDNGNGGTFDKNFTITVSDVSEGGGGGSGSNPNPIFGCTDSDANNFNPSANRDDGSCLYLPGAIVGCTDSTAGNYNPLATVDNGSCLYGVFGCMDSSATNYNPLAVYSNNSCIYQPIDPPDDDDDVNGCTAVLATNYNPLATKDDGSCLFDDESIPGCTDVSATNFSSSANIDDGSCTYAPQPPIDPPGGEGEPTKPNNPVSDIVVGFIKDNPEIPATVAVVGLLIPSLFQLLTAGAIAGAVSSVIRLWNLIPTLLGFKRRKRPWGTVYDSVTKQPLDPVYVTLKDSFGKDISTSITDLDGRYGFQVAPGNYSIVVNKANYNFPSVKLAGKTEDDLYHNLYFGGPITVESGEEIINKNIPMDAINFNWNEFEKAKNKKLMKFYSKTELFFARISKILFFAGFISSIALALLEPKTFNFVILGLYVLILILAFVGIKPRAFGFVTEKETGYPLSFGVVSVFSSELGREVAHTVIGKTGRYYLLVPKGEYFIKIKKKISEDGYQDIFESESFNVKKGYINKILKI